MLLQEITKIKLELKIYTDFENIPLSSHREEMHEGEQGIRGGLSYRLDSVVGFGVVNLRRFYQQYSAGSAVSGIILGRKDGELLVAQNVSRGLRDGIYSVSSEDVEKIPGTQFARLVVYPTTFEEMIPYDPSQDSQKDLDPEGISPELRHR